MGRPLVAFYSLDVALLPPGADGRPRVELTRKFVDGLKETRDSWGDEVIIVLAPRSRPDTNLDQDSYFLDELPVTLVVREPGDNVDDLIRGAAVVNICVDYRHVAVAAACRRLGVPYVVTAEYNLRTRLAIAAAEEKRLRRRTKRMLWEMTQEALQQRVIANSAGLQCNGTPTFEAWSALSPSPMLFFDSRVTPSMLATADHAASRGSGRTLRLAFSGRFIPMKGVLHLPEIAAALRRRGVGFTLQIFGAGPLEPQLRARITRLGLEDQVTLAGCLSFDSLMTHVANHVDLFVCPHVQGDPSCTYLETLACGVPVAGFANDAWRGLLARSNAGWSARIGDDEGLAAAIEQASSEPGALAAAAARGLAFARGHTFDVTSVQRGEHLRSVAR